MHHRRTAVLATGLSSFVIGCQAGDAPAPDASSVTDSAGIEIVESAAPAWDGDGWRISDTPSVVIGRREGDERYLLGWVGWRRGSIVLRDGRIAILDGQSAQVRVYSPEGEHIEDWGGHGEGPGEYSSPSSIFPYRGDSILVSEFVASRLTILDDQGRFGRNVVPEMGLTFVTEWRERMAEGDRSWMPSESCCRMWGALSSGDFLLSYPEMIPNTGTGTKRGAVSAAIVAGSGGAAEGVGDFEGGAYQLGLQGRPLRFHFASEFAMAPGSDGFFATEGDAYSISEYDTNGRLRRIIRLTRELRSVTDDIKAAHEARLREQILAPGALIEGGSPEEVLEIMLAPPYPSHLPAFDHLLVDPEGNLWAGQSSYGGGGDGRTPEVNEFFVFAPGGRHLGVVEVPADLSVQRIGSDFILALTYDDLEVSYVHMYAIEK